LDRDQYARAKHSYDEVEGDFSWGCEQELGQKLHRKQEEQRRQQHQRDRDYDFDRDRERAVLLIGAGIVAATCRRPGSCPSPSSSRSV
jgi:hypothetical protein